MTKFNVGDKVRFIENFGEYSKGDEVTIKSFIDTDHVKFEGEHGVGDAYTRRLELVKTTKNQRITALENEVAELRPLKQEVAELKLIVHELRGKKSIEPSASTVEDIIEFEGKQYRNVDREAREGDYVSVSFENGKCFKSNKLYGPAFFENKRLRVKADPSSGGEYEITSVYHDLYGRTLETVNVYELMKDGLNPQISMVDETIEPLTPNQQRAAIIEKAKAFVKENVANGRTINRKKDKGNSTYRENYYDIDFFYKERKVTAVVYWLAFNEKRFNKPACVGRAKCSPNDVFNEHIGKAIALGRALGLDVSEFEQAVQPNEVVMGMNLEVRTNREVDFNHKPVDTDDLIQCNYDFHKEDSGVFIINDTDAIYGGVE